MLENIGDRLRHSQPQQRWVRQVCKQQPTRLKTWLRPCRMQHCKRRMKLALDDSTVLWARALQIRARRESHGSSKRARRESHGSPKRARRKERPGLRKPRLKLMVRSPLRGSPTNRLPKLCPLVMKSTKTCLLGNGRHSRSPVS